MSRRERKTMRTSMKTRHSSNGDRRPVSAGAVVLLIACMLLPLAGCTMVGPDYTSPAVDAAGQWHTPLEKGLNDGQAARENLAGWWAVLDDPMLDSLEQRAMHGNLGLQEAAARVREARALRGIDEAALWPSLDSRAKVSTRRNSENSGDGKEGGLYAVGFDAGWELDIFGGRRRAVEAAQAEMEASEAALHDVLVSLTAEIALNYVDVRTIQARLAAAEANLAAQQKTYELNLSRYRAGLLYELAVQQSLYLLEHSRSQIPPLQAALGKARNRLAVLLGQNPGALDKELSANRAVPVPPANVAVGVPADTLRRRPDVRRAERGLAAATARIGVATADLYPKFRLLGSIGLESLTAENLTEWPSRTWSAGPSISWKIFDAGAVRRNIEVQNARQEQALRRYESAVLGAREEVENGLLAYAREQNRHDSLEKAVDAARKAEMLARDRFKAGLVDFSNVLDAQRAMLAYEDELAGSKGTVTANLIRLYKALGGGWQSMADNGVGETAGDVM